MKGKNIDTEECQDTVVYESSKDGCLNLLAIEGTVWMTMQQMGMVFGVDRSVIGKHVRNIYATGELVREATWAKIAQVRVEGTRKVTRSTEYYSVDMIIAVGYRVCSKEATRFRIWATDVLKRYLMNGKVEDDRWSKLEHRMTAAERSIEAIVYTLMPALPENREPIGYHT